MADSAYERARRFSGPTSKSGKAIKVDTLGSPGNMRPGITYEVVHHMPGGGNWSAGHRTIEDAINEVARHSAESGEVMGKHTTPQIAREYTSHAFSIHPSDGSHPYVGTAIHDFDLGNQTHNVLVNFDKMGPHPQSQPFKDRVWNLDKQSSRVHQRGLYLRGELN